MKIRSKPIVSLLAVAPFLLYGYGCTPKPEPKPEEWQVPKGQENILKPYVAKHDPSIDAVKEQLKHEHSLPVWQPTERSYESVNLTIKESLVPFQIKSPKHYLVTNSTNSYGELFLFRGIRRKDGTVPSFIVNFIPKLPKQKNQDNIWDCLESALNETHKGRPCKWQQSNMEAGKIGNLIFVRQYWQGEDTYLHKMMHGFVYLGRRGDTLIIIASQDYDPYSKGTVALAEAAILSFQAL